MIFAKTSKVHKVGTGEEKFREAYSIRGSFFNIER